MPPQLVQGAPEYATNLLVPSNKVYHIVFPQKKTKKFII